MKKFGKLIVKLRIPILILSVLLLIPAAIGYFNTKVNYDILYYLPGDIDTMRARIYYLTISARAPTQWLWLTE